MCKPILGQDTFKRLCGETKEATRVVYQGRCAFSLLKDDAASILRHLTQSAFLSNNNFDKIETMSPPLSS